MTNSKTLIECVLQHARQTPTKLFAKLLFSNQPPVSITYADLLNNGTRFARFLEARGVKKQQVVILILKHSPELIYGFVGAMLHGAVPSIFAFPSAKISQDVYDKTLQLLLEVCDTRTVLTYPELAEQLKSPPSGKAVPIDILLANDYASYPNQSVSPSALPDDIVLLQHSSGTTGLKKGVALSNKAVLNQIRNYATALNLNDDDKIASWLPLYHDMGLIACFVLPLIAGIPVTMMSPFDWISNPSMLLDTINKERSTLCWQPNFAYNLLASNISEAQSAGMDLSCVRAFINCAEPIQSDSHRLFYERFKSVGVRREALATCYAMAENTFAVTQSVVGRSPATTHSKNRRELVSSGEIIPQNEVRIVDKDRNVLPELSEGEIAIKSDSQLSEYYHRPDLTKDAIADGWYYSGDLGFLDKKTLYVTGRKKDMIIVAGKNIYPQDIEEVVSRIDSVVPGRVVGFGVYNEGSGTEDVVILAETEVTEKAKQLELKLSISRAIKDQLECIANDIVLLPRQTLLKSSSGKIARSANREKYVSEWRKNVVS